MRLVSFVPSTQASARFGVLDDDLVIEPDTAARFVLGRRFGEAAAEGRVEPIAADMVAFFESGVTGHRRAEQALELVRSALVAGDDLASDVGAGVYRIAEVRLLAPVPRPRRIRDYLTYRAHAAGSGLDAGRSAMTVPSCYQANVETIVGPGEPLTWPSYSDQLDFELELGFFAAVGGRDLSVAEAQHHIAGMTLFNDVSARDIQFLEMSLGIGPSKGKHFCSAMGPCVVTMDEVDEWNVELSASVNGETWVAGTSRDREFSFAEVLAWASLDEPIYPGEFFALGTIGGGCGLELDRWIQPGDLVELQATGVGVLANPVARRSPQREGAGLDRYAGAPRAVARHG